MTPNPPIFLVSRFRSGSSFLWNLFRQDEQYCCFYEPFHDNLPEALETTVPPQASHRGIDSYWDEYAPVRDDLAALHRPQFGLGDFFLKPGDKRPELAKFIQHLIRTAEREGRTCVIKCNRLDFRLPWLRANFPEARLVHMVRNARDQWISSVRQEKMEHWDRLEENRGYDLPVWIASLAPAWPFLLSKPRQPAYYYSYLLWKLSSLFGQRFAHYHLDFDHDVAEDHRRFQKALAPFFPGDFFERPVVKETFDPTHPGGWRRFRTEEWFADLEAQAERVLDGAGVYKPAFWRWSSRTNPKVPKADENQKAIALALLTFSRHRGELMIHSHQLRESLARAEKYAESLNAEYTKSTQTLRTTESTKQEAEYKLRLLQAVYDSLKQVHELSLTSLNKTLEEFQFTTRELRQLITYKDEQIQQLGRALPSGPSALQLATSQSPSPGATNDAAAQEQHTRDQAALDQLKRELASVQTGVLASRTLEKHALALEQSSADNWTALNLARHQIADLGTARAQLETDLRREQSALADSTREVQRLIGQLDTALQRIGTLEQSLTAQLDELRQARQLEDKLRLELSSVREQIARTEDTAGSQLARDQATIDELRQALASAHQRVGTLEQSLKAQLAELGQAGQLEEELRLGLASLREQVARAEDHASSQLARDQTTIDELRQALASAQVGALTARSLEKHVKALEQSSTDNWAALSQARHEIANFSVVRGQFEAELRRERSARADSTQETQRLAGQLAEALQRISTLEESLAKNRGALDRAELTGAALKAEQTGRLAEKRAYDERAAIFTKQAAQAHQQLEAASAKHQQEAADLRTQLGAATARLAAIDQSWAVGVIRRLTPAAFKPSDQA